MTAPIFTGLSEHRLIAAVKGQTVSNVFHVVRADFRPTPEWAAEVQLVLADWFRGALGFPVAPIDMVARDAGDLLIRIETWVALTGVERLHIPGHLFPNLAPLRDGVAPQLSVCLHWATGFAGRGLGARTYCWGVAGHNVSVHTPGVLDPGPARDYVDAYATLPRALLDLVSPPATTFLVDLHRVAIDRGQGRDPRFDPITGVRMVTRGLRTQRRRAIAPERFPGPGAGL